MSLQDVMLKVEDHQFAAEMNLASGSVTFYNSLRNHWVFRELAEQMKGPNVPEAVLRRLIELSNRSVQPQFENPFDVALTTYLTMLDLYNPELVRRGAEVVSQAPNCWWATEMALRLLARIDLGQMTTIASEPAMNATSLGRTPRVIATQTGIPASYHGAAPGVAAVTRGGRRSIFGHRRRHPRRLAVA